MGRKRLGRGDLSEMNSTLLSMFVPANILKDFDFWGVHGQQGNKIIELREKQDRVPESLSKDAKSGDIVLDGFCNPVDMMSFGFSLGPVYLRIYRRRWKKKGENKHFSNEYDLTLKGFKIVPELGIFLKEEDRRLSG